MAGALTFKLGFALQFSPQLPDLTRRFGSKLALGGKQHLLISLPSLSIPASTETVWASLIKLGFSVLLAHPECNPAVRRDPARLARWIASGIFLQLDAPSVTGVHGRDVKRFALDCLRKFGDRVVLASNSRPGGHEVSKLKKACEEVGVKVGQLQAGKSFYLTPAEIIESTGPRHAKARADSTRGVGNFLNSLTQLKSFRGA
jgi:tyrosine-protein phosphatase YwqE